MNVREEIEALVEFEGRGPGSDAERRAAEHLVERLRAMGREAETETVDTWPNWALTYAVHAFLVIVGSVVSVIVPVIGALLVLVVVVLTFLDAIGMAFTTRKLLGRRSSQNVISREDNDKGGDLYLVAHYDAGRGGLAYHPKLQERRAAFGKLVRRGIGPMEPFFWAMLAVLVCVLVRLTGIDNMLLTVFQFIFTVLLIISLPLLLDTAFASPVPGANDNASGVATVMRLADRFGGELEHFNLNLLLTGSQEGGSLGMRSYLKRRKGDLEPARTVFLNVDEVGRGTVRFSSREGLLLPIESHNQLVDVCEQMVEAKEQEREEEEANDEEGPDENGGRERDEDRAAAGDQERDEDRDDEPDENRDEERDGDRNDDRDDERDEERDEGRDDERDEDRPGVRSMTWRTSTDGYAARSASFPAISITCKARLDYTPGHHQRTDTDDRVDDEALERAYAFIAELVGRIDETVGPDLAKPAEETLLKEES